MLHRHYIKDEDYDVRWLGKYVSAPWEAAALAAVVFSVISWSTIPARRIVWEF
jgi:hypothetical protein